MCECASSRGPVSVVRGLTPAVLARWEGWEERSPHWWQHQHQALARWQADYGASNDAQQVLHATPLVH